MAKAFDYLMEKSEPWYVEQVRHSYSHGVAHTQKEVKQNENDPRTWMNPLEVALPHAPDIRFIASTEWEAHRAVIFLQGERYSTE